MLDLKLVQQFVSLGFLLLFLVRNLVELQALLLAVFFVEFVAVLI